MAAATVVSSDGTANAPKTHACDFRHTSNARVQYDQLFPFWKMFDPESIVKQKAAGQAYPAAVF